MMTRARAGAITAVLCAGFISPLAGQQPAEQPPAAARAALAHLVGDWTSRWDYLDGAGKVVQTVTGTERFAFILGEAVLGLQTVIPELNRSSQAWVFYSVPDSAMYLTSVDQRGDLWILSGDAGFHRIVSRPKRQPNGRDLVIRFTHTQVATDTLDALMEYTVDGGATWAAGFRQRMIRTHPSSPSDS